jgi:hypothetical protein
LITLEELAEVSVKTKNSVTPGEDNVSIGLCKYAAEEFKLSLLKYLDEAYFAGKFADDLGN